MAYESKLNALLDELKIAYTVKSRNLNRDSLDMIYEIQTDEGERLVQEIGKLDEVLNVSILDHDGTLRH